MTINFNSAVENDKRLPHQIDAWKYLQESTSKEVQDEFAKRFRNEKVIPKFEGIPQSGLKLIQQFESCQLKSYYDPHTGGLPITIGWGSTRNKDGKRFMIGVRITQQEADDLLHYQIKTEFLPALRKIPYWDQMNEKQQGALLSFAYNVGSNFYGLSGFDTITRVLKNREWEKVAAALFLYHNPGTNVAEGLKKRRKAEGDLWNTVK